MEESDYLNSINKSSIYRNDLMYAEKLEIETFDPTTMGEEPRHCLFIASSGYGKSRILCDFIFNSHKDYDLILMISTTARRQKIYNWLPRENILDDFDEEFLTMLWDHNKNIGDKNQSTKLDRILIIFDDIINSPEYKKSKILDDFFCYGRQYGFTIYILSQMYSGIKLKHRQNCMYAVTFNIDSCSERSKFCDSFLSLKNKRIGDLIFKKITRDKERDYQAIVIEKYKKGFEITDKVKKYTATMDVDFKVTKTLPKLLEKWDRKKNIHIEKEAVKEITQKNKPFDQYFYNTY